MKIIKTLPAPGKTRYREALTTDTPGLVLVPAKSQVQENWAWLVHRPSGRALACFNYLENAFECASDMADWVDWTIGEPAIIEKLGVSEAEFWRRMRVAARHRGGVEYIDGR